MSRLDLPGTPDTLMAEWFAAENVPNAPLLEAVNALRTAGWVTCSGRRVRQLHAGARKPDAASFERVSADLNRQHPGLAPASIAFWDDTQANVTAAQAAGWTAFLCSTPEDFGHRLATLD